MSESKRLIKGLRDGADLTKIGKSNMANHIEKLESELSLLRGKLQRAVEAFQKISDTSKWGIITSAMLLMQDESNKALADLRSDRIGDSNDMIKKSCKHCQCSCVDCGSCGEEEP